MNALIEALPTCNGCVEPIEQWPEGVHPCVGAFDRISQAVQPPVKIIIPVHILAPFVMAHVGIDLPFIAGPSEGLRVKTRIGIQEEPFNGYPRLARYRRDHLELHLDVMDVVVVPRHWLGHR